MTIQTGEDFTNRLADILIFIAKDSKQRAFDFKNELEKSISSLDYMPYKLRKSIYFDDENIRDFIFKGYCIPYEIDLKNEQITLISIIKWIEYLS